MNIFKTIEYDTTKVVVPIAYEMNDYDVYLRTHINTVVNREFNCNTKPNSYTSELINNILENIEQSTILNGTTVNVMIKNNLVKLFANETGNIYAVDISSNMLTDDLYRAIMDSVKYMINKNTEHFDDFVYVSLTFSPIGEK